jgi:2-oxoglutarate ferredoxin oxidoreductase subunit beta
MSAEPTTPTSGLTKKDFMSDQTIRWCPGCGDYSILSQVQTVFPSLGVKREDFVVVSGIGCSSRFPYYMNTYGFHTIHGRAPAIATGLKATRPELSVWIITGDGDALSIGGNHIIHLMRRNLDVNVLMFNNRIYGLTKGQYSPTSEVGKKTKSSPMGSVDHPFNSLSLVLGAGATFVARSVDVFPVHLRTMVERTHAHKGTSFLEIYQNCNIFNDGAFDDFTTKDVREDRVLYLEHGKPMIWGGARKWGLKLEGMNLRKIEIGVDGTEADVLVHDETNLPLAMLVASMDTHAFAVPVGVFYRSERPVYEEGVQKQIAESRKKLGNGELAALIKSGEIWRLGPNGVSEK